MPDVDDSVRAEIERMARQVHPSNDVLAEVARRVRRRQRIRTMKTGLLIAVVLVGTVLGTLGLLRVFGHNTTVAAGPIRARIATATVRSDLLVVVSARRASAHTSATTVRVTALVARGGGWRPTGAALMGRPGGWRWGAVTGPAGVCQMVVSETPGNVRVALRLERGLAGPADGKRGCSSPLEVLIRQGRVLAR